MKFLYRTKNDVPLCFRHAVKRAMSGEDIFQELINIVGQFPEFDCLDCKSASTEGPPWWEVLHVSKNCSIPEIKYAYRKLLSEGKKNNASAEGLAVIEKAYHTGRDYLGCQQVKAELPEIKKPKYVCY